MRIEQLIFLREVAQTKSMSKAAANLYVTPQYISKAIKLLEEELGVKIFRRAKTGLYLTMHGENIYEKTLSILTQWDELSSNLIADKQDVGAPAGRYNIYVSHELRKLFSALTTGVLLRAPELELEIFEQDSLDIIKQIIHEQIHPDIFALTMEKGDLSLFDSLPKYYDVYTICEDTLHVIVSASHPLCQDPNNHAHGVNMKKLLPEQFGFCIGPQNRYNTIIQLLAKHELKVNTRIIANTLEDIFDFTRKGACITITGGTATNLFIEDNLRALPMSEKISVVYRLFIHHKCADDAFIVQLLNQLRNKFQSNFRKVN